MDSQQTSDGGVTVAAVLTVQAIAQKTDVQEQNPQPAPSIKATKRVIIVSLEDRKLALVEDGQVRKVYTVAVGKPSTPSPVGEFTIERRVANPTYSHDGKVEAFVGHTIRLARAGWA